MNSADRSLLGFHSEYEKARYLDGAARQDAESSPRQMPRLDALAWAMSQAHGKSALELCTFCLRWVRDRIYYQRDPGHEQFADSEVMLERFWDDCDGKSRLFMALVLRSAMLAGLTIEARIRPVYRGGHWTHAQAEVRFAGSDRHPLAEAGGWLLCDPIVAGAEVGIDPEALRKRGKIPIT